MKNSTIDEILAALKTLGVEGKITLTPAAYNRIEVKINEEYFGIWDILRKTFVD